MEDVSQDRSGNSPNPPLSYYGSEGRREYIQRVSAAGDQIPRPPALVSPDDESRNQYVSEALSDEEKKQLKQSAENMMDILIRGGQYKMGVLNSASSNLSHYVNGGAETLNIGDSEMQKLERDGDGYSENKGTNLFNFTKQVYEDFSVSEDVVAAYISLNPAGARNVNWFGASTRESTEMFYAMGGFSYAFGALATRKIWNGRKIVEIRTRTYVSDRYNWDRNKMVRVPKDDAELGNRVLNLGGDGLQPVKNTTFTAPNGVEYPYLMEKDGNYIVTDALPGILMTLGGAEPYSIVGEGQETVSRYFLPE